MEIITKQATTTAVGEQKGIKKRDGKKGLCGEALEGFWGLVRGKLMKAQIF